MATGYTHKIKDGITFEQFAMGCARAFGACVEMRDDPSDVPIPEKFEPSIYHKKALAECRKTLAKIEGMKAVECDAESEKEYSHAKKLCEKRIREGQELAEKYKAMLCQIANYTPPSKDHEGFKKFMIEQVSESLKFDYGVGYDTRELASLRKLSAKEWKAEAIKKAKDDIAYHTKEDKEECARAEGRTLWVKQLRDSLKP